MSNWNGQMKPWTTRLRTLPSRRRSLSSGVIGRLFWIANVLCHPLFKLIQTMYMKNNETHLEFYFQSSCQERWSVRRFMLFRITAALLSSYSARRRFTVTYITIVTMSRRIDTSATERIGRRNNLLSPSSAPRWTLCENGFCVPLVRIACHAYCIMSSLLHSLRSCC